MAEQSINQVSASFYSLQFVYDVILLQEVQTVYYSEASRWKSDQWKLI